MLNCSRCKKTISTDSDDFVVGMCKECAVEVEKELAEQVAIDREAKLLDQRRNARSRVKNHTGEPVLLPFSGLILIGIAVGLAIIGLMLIGFEHYSFGRFMIFLAVMVYLAGVIRWAVSGSQFLQLNRLYRQNSEIIDLLEVIADKGQNNTALELIRSQRDSGELSDEEFIKHRRELLSRNKFKD